MTQYDCILLDLMIPKVDGLTLLKEMRLKGNKTPVLILTARTLIEVVAGLDSGANYIILCQDGIICT
jgi:DNA-binding response OmpR family regulator